MTNQEQKFEAGQTVKIITTRSYGKKDSVKIVQIKSVWKNGVVSCSDGSIFRPDGTERKSYGRFSRTRCYLAHLKSNETVESIKADEHARQQAEQNIRDGNEAKYQSDIISWWDNKGSGIWQHRQVLSEKFNGHEVNIITYQQRGEMYMPFVVIETRKDFRGEDELSATVGGLIGRDEHRVSTFSSGSHTAKTIKELLYKICN